MKLFSIGSEDDNYVYRHEIIAEGELDALNKFAKTHPNRRIADVYEITPDSYGFYLIYMEERI